MKLERKFVTGFISLVLLLLLTSCNKKKTALPPHTLAPTIAVALPDEIPEQPVPPAPEVSQVPPETPAVKPKPKSRAKNAPKKTTPVAGTTPAAGTAAAPASATAVASARPPRTSATDVPSETALAAAQSIEQVVKQKETTAQLLDSTENSLKSLTRNLSDQEKDMKAQIQSYIAQSHKATTDGDFERAFNLAKKAQLLADGLIKK